MTALREHVKGQHRRLNQKMPRSNGDLARAHAHDHLHHGWALNHYHGEAELRNRGTGVVPGWRDGTDVTPRPPRIVLGNPR